LPYKAFIGKGNNGNLLKNALKSRYWWTIVDTNEDDPEINFLWT